MVKKTYLELRKSLNFNFNPQHLAEHFAIDLCLFAGGSYLTYLGGLFILLAAPLFSVLMFRNFCLMHEAVHSIAHNSKKINAFLGFISGTFCFLPYFLWKEIHIQHHYWAGNYQKDPALGLAKNYEKFPFWLRKTLDISWRLHIPFSAIAQHVVFWWHSALYFRKKDLTAIQKIEALAPIAFYLLLGAFSSPGLKLALLLGLGFYLYLVELVNFPHHAGLYLEPNETSHLPVWDQHHVSRTCKYPDLVERFVVLNFNYHIEHHLFPNLPWHQLKKVNLALAEDRVKEGSGFMTITNQWLLDTRKKSFKYFLGLEQSGFLKISDEANLGGFITNRKQPTLTGNYESTYDRETNSINRADELKLRVG